jgi:PAS domain S-box-containing protein
VNSKAVFSARNIEHIEKIHALDSQKGLSMTAKPSYEELESRIEELEKTDNIRNKIEKELQKSEAKHSKMVANIGDVIVIIDQDGINRYKSPNIEKLFGWKPEDVIGASTWDNVHPDDIEFTQQFFEKIMHTPDAVGTMECRYRCKDGSYKWIEFSGSNLFHDPDIQGLLGNYQDITERKQAQKTLQESEEKFRLTFHTSPDSINLNRLEDGVYIDINDGFTKLMGYTRQDVVGKSSLALNIWANPEDRQLLVAGLKEHGIVENLEAEFTDKNGQKKTALMSARILRINDEDLILSITRDITERKQAEMALINSEKKWRDILINTPQIGITLNPNAEIVFVNAYFLKLTGWEEQEIIGRDWFDTFIPENIRNKVRGVFKTAMSQKGTHGLSSYENEIMAKDRTLMNVAWSNVLTKDTHGKIVDITCLGIDLTERKRAEEELKRSEENYRLLVENQTDLVVKVDLDGRFQFVSPSYCRMFDKRETEILGKYFMPLVHEDDREPTAKAMEALFSPPYTAYIEQRAMTKEGWRWLAWADTAVIDKAGRVKEIIGVGRDITVRKQAEAEREKLQAQLLQAQKMESVGRLAGGVAHDFNNMLGVILGHTELALLKTDENHELHGDLKEIQKAAKRSADITKQLLAFARKQNISPEQLNLNDTVESMLNMLRRLIGEDIDLVWKPSAHLWPVKMDPTQVDQVLANLCVNARDAISGVGKLTIETGRKTFDEEYCKEHAGFIPGDFVLLAVSDNGCGMDKDTLDNLFEPFFTTKGVGKGTGLGLATIYGIVKQNKGFINVYSEPGQGSTFKIYLPRLVVDEDLDKAMPEKKAVAGGTETILLVEDEPSILRMTRMMLERKGYSVLPAATPAEALEKAKNHSGSIDLLMTDVVMPEMNGRDLATKIKVLYPEIRLLFMSGYTANVIAHHGVLDVGVAFIQKPFSIQDMTAKLREMLDMATDKS